MDDENVVTFRPRAGAAPPGLPPLPAAPPAPTTAPPPPPGAGAVAVAERPRQSAAAALAALAPVRAPMPPAPAPTRAVPATFRSEGLDDGPGDDGPGLPLGALSLSAILAVALAALRGTVGFVQDWRQRRMEKQAEEAAWRQARVKRRAAEEDALAAAAKSPVPSSAEFGRKAVRDGRKGPGGAPQGRPAGPQGGGTGGTGKAPRPPERKSPERRHDSPRPLEKRPKGPGGASEGVVSPRRGKGGQSGGADKSALGRVRDRKRPGGADDPKPDPKNPKKPQKELPGGDPVKDRKRPGPKGRTGPTEQDQGKGAPGRGPKKKPGIRHGTPEGHDTHGCRCVRCRRAARRRDEAAKTKAKGPQPQPSTPGSEGRKRRERPGKKRRQKTGPGTPPPSGPGGRRGADEDLRSSAEHGETVITVERADRPGDQERKPPPPAAITTGVPGLPRAPEQPAGARPGTTRTSTSTKESPMSAPLPGMFTLGQDMDAEHRTEVTLDEVLDHLTKSKERCFRTYDECADLADAARKLRRALEKVLDDLKGRHNVRGRLTRAAAHRLADCMDVVARKAEEMREKSLLAAESVEIAHDAMADAYRPVQEAAADAGLAAPSARIHNED
ncbi:hypothetical protein [Streptomyces sp. NPDC001108]